MPLRREILQVSREFTDLQNSFGKIVTYLGNINKLKNAEVNTQLQSHKALQVKKKQAVDKKDRLGLLTAMNLLGSAVIRFADASAEQADNSGLGIPMVGMLGGVGKLGKVAKVAGILGAGGLALGVGSRLIDGQGAGQIAAGVGGGALGMAGGAALGSRIGSIGGAPGAAIGGLVGGAAGYMGGSSVGDATHNYVTNRDKPAAEGYSRRFADYVSGSVKNVAAFLMASPLGMGIAAAKSAYDAGSDLVSGISEGWSGEAPVSGNAASAQSMNYFMGQGWTKEQAAGIVGNLQVESGNFSPDVITGERRGDGGKAVGIAQWHPDRQKKFSSIFGRPLYGATLEQQLQFIQRELTGPEKVAGNRLSSASTASDAAIVIDKFYERSSGEARGQRIANANSLADNQGFFKSLGQQIGSGAGQVASGAGRVFNDTKESLGRSISGIGRFLFPVTSPRITSQFGMRRHPVSGGQKMHHGIDFGAKRPGIDGDPVYAAADGMVVRAGPAGGYGNLVEIAHSNGLVTRYGHLKKIAVTGNLSVKKGQPIGTMGNTGSSTAAHLHFEVRKNGSPINPASFLSQGAVQSPGENATEDDGGPPKAGYNKNWSFSKEAQEAATRRKGSVKRSIHRARGGSSLFVAPAKPTSGKGSILRTDPKRQYSWYFTGQ